MEHTIGLDLGHCETAAAFPQQPYVNDSRYEVKRLVTEDKDQVILTQVVLTEDQMKKLSGKLRPSYAELCELGEIKIGNKLPVYIPNGEKFCYFKVPPKDFDKPCGNTAAAKKYGITHGQIMACYVFALINSIFEYNRGELNTKRKDIVLLIGCPTTKDWTDEKAQSEYANLVKKATNVKDVRIIPESRAAMFSSVENEKNKISAIKGAVVFDFGSSTADCTYMLLGRKIIEFSWTLGASEIERQMAREAYEAEVKSHGAFDLEMESFAAVVNELRAAKEGYYNKIYGPYGHRMFCDFIGSKDGKRVESQICVNDEFMQNITEKRNIQVLCDSRTSKSGTWMSLCKSFFEEAKNKINNSTYTVIDQNGKRQPQKCEIDTIVLTGGASKMDFVYELCKQVFPKATIYRENNPAHTVSNGLGWVAVSDNNLQSCTAKAKNEILDNSSCSIEALCTSISNVVFNKLCDIFEEKTTEWADKSGDDLSAADLVNAVFSHMENQTVQNELLLLGEKEISTWKNNLSSAIETAVNNQVKKLYVNSVAKGLVVPHDIWKQLNTSILSLEEIDVSKILNGIDMSGSFQKVLKVINHLIIWTVAGALAVATGGAAIIVATLASAINEAALTDEDLNKPRKQKIRQRVKRKIKDKLVSEKSSMMKEFDEILKVQTSNFEDSLHKVLKVAFEIVTLKRFEL